MQFEQTPEDLDQAREQYERQQEKQPYTPRPKWQPIMAWVLLGIVVLGILNLVYWQMRP